MAEFIFKGDKLIIVPIGFEELLELETLLTSKEIRYIHSFDQSHKMIQIPPDEVDRALQEIDAWQHENRNWQQHAQSNQENPSLPFSPTHACVVLLLAIFHWFTSRFESSPLWKEQGMLVAEKVLSGEWARTVTALTLHSDFPHLLGNFAALWLFSIGLGNRLGDGITWLLILLSGISGNLANALFYQSGHNSIGASTAVFGAVGILGVIQFKHHRHNPVNRYRKWVPLGAALGLFAMLGTNPSSDVTAHIFGFVAGLILGYGINFTGGQKFKRRHFIQIVAFVVFSGLILLSWKMQHTPYNKLFAL